MTTTDSSTIAGVVRTTPTLRRANGRVFLTFELCSDHGQTFSSEVWGPAAEPLSKTLHLDAEVIVEGRTRPRVGLFARVDVSAVVERAPTAMPATETHPHA